MKEDKHSNASQPVTDDQDLAQVLAANSADSASGGLQFEAAPLPPQDGTAPVDDAPAAAPATDAPQTTDDSALSAALDEAVNSLPEPAAAPAAPAPAEAPAAHGAPHTANPELDSIKKSALEELRPLVDKLDLKADEKFDTLLLIIRSTDDKSLLGPAHEAAKAIEDDAKRAQALLDVIKEVDYFSGQAA